MYESAVPPALPAREERASHIAHRFYLAVVYVTASLPTGSEVIAPSLPFHEGFSVIHCA